MLLTRQHGTYQYMRSIVPLRKYIEFGRENKRYITQFSTVLRMVRVMGDEQSVLVHQRIQKWLLTTQVVR